MIKTVGLITARGGSKSIPQKNVRLLAGKPLIAWTIEAALRSQGLSRVIVSTDDEEIARVSREWGADVPFMRPAELAQDDSPHLGVIRHALGWLASENEPELDYLMLLQPTSPLRTTADIDSAIALCKEKDADAVVSVCLTHDHPYLTKQLTPDGRLLDFVEKPPGYLARQTLPPAFALNGAIYLVRRSLLLERDDWYTDRTFAYIMPAERSLDIDTPWDLHLVDLILRETNGLTSD